MSAVAPATPAGIRSRRRPVVGLATGLSTPAELYLLAVVAASAIWGGSLLGRLDLHESWPTFAVLASAAATAQLFAIHTPRNQVFHTSIVFVLAGVLLLPPELVVLMCVLQHVPDWLKERYRWYIQTFNISNYVVAALTAKSIVGEVNDALSEYPGLAGALAAVSACVVFLAVNRVLLAGMLKLGRGVSFRDSHLLMPEDVALDLVLAAMGVTGAVIWSGNGWLMPVAFAPLVLIYSTQRSVHKLHRASDTIQLQNDSLEQANRLLKERSAAAMESLAATVDARDAYTAGHSRRVQRIALRLGRELELTEAELELLGHAALFHDIGKLAVPDAVLLKPGPLDDDEWVLMRSHAEEGALIIARLDFLTGAVSAIRHHHERFDGSGYPDRVEGEEIPLAARIIHLADALDSMLTSRVYRPALSVATALEEVKNGAGRQFCPRCVAALEGLIEREGLDEELQFPAPALLAGG